MLFNNVLCIKGIGTNTINNRTMTMVESIKCDDMVKTALIKYNYGEPTTVELAQHVGFNDDEIRMLKTFWEPVFNKSWIYLSPSMITNEMGYKKVSHFYKDTMYTQYIDNVDYKEVAKHDDAVLSYTDFQPNVCGGLNLRKHKDNRGGHNTKYYVVTGRTLKKMLMKCKTKRGDAVCEYYLKVEELAIFMKDYISAMHQYLFTKQIEEQRMLIEATNKKANDMKIINDRIQTHINNTKTLDKNSTFYITTSTRYAQQNIFKPGCIDSIGKKSLKARLAQYNTGKTGDDLFYFCHIVEVYDARTLDYKLKKLMAQLKFNKNKEMVVLHYDTLINIVNRVHEHHLEDYETWNDFITSGEYKLQLDKTPIIPADVWNHTITLTEQKDGKVCKTKTIDVADLTDAQKKDYLIQAIEIFCTDNEMEYNHEADKDNADKKITIIWKDLQSILKKICCVKKLQPSKWRDPLKTISTDSKSIDQIKWVKKN